ncbi:MAG TPA: hypothetical protein VFH03_27345 [Actinoplanes sp.]|nr:hypothetical protein [Actinoplanes sp.]
MDFSIEDVLHGLWTVQIAGCVGLAGYWLHRRTSSIRARRRLPLGRHAVGTTEPAAVDPEPNEELTDTGRHHVPRCLLDSPTYRISAGRIGRAKVPHRRLYH